MAIEPVRVGLVGAGPWASMLHAAMWAAGPETALTGIWARRPEAAATLAAQHGVHAAPSFEALLDRSDAVAFAVAPEAQWNLAIQAARQGKHVILEKPIADSLHHAQLLAAAIIEAGVGSMVMFTARFNTQVRAFLDQAQSFDAVGARAAMLTPAFLGGPFADSPWRRQRGALLDIGPHVMDLVTAALGPATRVIAHASTRGWVDVRVDHESGAVSEMVLSGHISAQGGRFNVELYGPEGALEIDILSALDPTMLPVIIRAELVDVVRGAPHTCNIRRALYIQEVLEAAEQSIDCGPISLGELPLKRAAAACD